MSRLLNWIKAHKWQTVVLVVGIYFFINIANAFFGVNLYRLDIPSSSPSYSGSTGVANPGMEIGSTSSGYGAVSDAPSFNLEKRSDNSSERMVIQNSNLSFLVKDVKEVGEKVVNYAKEKGGFMVSVSYNRPTQEPYGTVTVRVPSKSLDETLAYYRSLAIKVTNENLVGTDITDQYTDIDARLLTLERTKLRFEEIFNEATTIDEILRVQQQIMTLQGQIDSLKGQKDALLKDSEYAKLTIYLSTDELALPYTPDKTFRPAVTFKLAFRSLQNTLRVFGEVAIWLGVYSVIWLPVLLIYLYFKRRKSKVVAN